MIMRGPQQDRQLLRLPSPFSLLPEDPKSLLLVQVGRLHHGTPKKPPRSTLLESQPPRPSPHAPGLRWRGRSWPSKAGGARVPSLTACFRLC